MAGFEPKLPLGNHRVALTKFGGKESAKDGSVRVEAEVVILETDNPNVKLGALHSWMWPISASGHQGTYAQDRSKKFIFKVQESIGQTDIDTGEFGDSMDEDFRKPESELYGVQLEVAVTPVMKNGGIMKGKNGDDVYNANWTALEQGDENITETRGVLAELGYKHKVATAAAIKPAEETAPAPRKLGGLGKLTGK